MWFFVFLLVFGTSRVFVFFCLIPLSLFLDVVPKCFVWWCLSFVRFSLQTCVSLFFRLNLMCSSVIPVSHCTAVFSSPVSVFPFCPRSSSLSRLWYLCTTGLPLCLQQWSVIVHRAEPVHSELLPLCLPLSLCQQNAPFVSLISFRRALYLATHSPPSLPLPPLSPPLIFPLWSQSLPFFNPPSAVCSLFLPWFSCLLLTRWLCCCKFTPR